MGSSTPPRVFPSQPGYGQTATPIVTASAPTAQIMQDPNRPQGPADSGYFQGNNAPTTAAAINPGPVQSQVGGSGLTSEQVQRQQWLLNGGTGPMPFFG